MDRRETLRNIILGGLAGTGILTGCAPESATPGEVAADTVEPAEGYGRFPAEKEHDAELRAETFFRPAEMATLAVLSDIILPADDRSGSATEAGVPDFIEFISKDIPELQLPLRGGLAWLDNESRRRYDGKVFTEATETERLAIIDEIAYPDPEADVLDAGTTFFNLMRFLTLTGFYTSREGVKEDLAYAGNVPNQWDGVPAEVLAAHGMDYPEEWRPHFLDIATQQEVAKWDEEGNLIS